jgi:[ribosomal protein S18]-alanine N-acetyltransferase
MQGPQRKVHVEKVAVAPPHRRRGVAAKMLALLLLSVSRTCSSMAVLRLNVDSRNTAAKGLYTSVGFVVRGERANYYKPGLPALVMELDVEWLQAGGKLAGAMQQAAAALHDPTRA